MSEPCNQPDEPCESCCCPCTSYTVTISACDLPLAECPGVAEEVQRLATLYGVPVVLTQEVRGELSVVVGDPAEGGGHA